MNWLTKRLLRGRPADPLDASRWAAVEASLPFLDRLSADARARLRRCATTLLDRKEFSGAAGLVVTDEMRLSIALQACLPVLELGLSAYDGWVGIIVYPGDFVIPRSTSDDDGVVHAYDEIALGEAWEGGPVVLSWFDDPQDYDGANVVIHEFAHKLDMLGGDADGCPPLHAGMSVEAWDQAFGTAFDDIVHRVDTGQNTTLDPYAAEDPAEFFAVASEAFFVEPLVLYAAYPQVYRQLSAFYRQDPGGVCK